MNLESSFKEKIMLYIHIDPLVGHFGYLKIYKRAKRDFYWPRIKGNIKRLVRKCEVDQSIKNETLPPAGLFQPLPFLNRPG